MTYQEFKTEFKMFRDKCDPWGESLSLHFVICDTLSMRNAHIPAKWEYSQSLCGADTDAPYFEDIQDIDSTDLIKLGNVLSRHVRLMEHMGHSY